MPDREKDNGIRYMVFSDNQRIFLGDFIIECAPNIDACEQAILLPVEYPAEVASGDHISHRWSEMIIAPDNRHVSWTTLFSNYSAMVFVGKLEKTAMNYRIVDPQIISTVDAFVDDPAHPGGVIPQPVRGGEVKQFVRGGVGISLVGAVRRDTPDSVVLDLRSGVTEAVTDTPGYTETTIFSPDERLGITMTTRFSEHTDPAVLGLMPRPYPVSLNVGLSMHAYMYSVAGVRRARRGNIGPALIDINPSQNQPGYLGRNLNTELDWVYYSPMSWAPDSKSAMWMEGARNDQRQRIQVVRLPDYQPGPPVAAQATPDDIPYAIKDMSAVQDFVHRERDISARVYGRRAGHIEYRRTGALVEKTYVDFDDGDGVYSGSERTQLNPGGTSVYTANVRLSGAKSGVMDLRITFGPLSADPSAPIIFAPDSVGAPASHGYAEYDGQRLEVSNLLP